MVFFRFCLCFFLALSDLLKSRPRPEGIVLNMLFARSAAIFQSWPHCGFGGPSSSSAGPLNHGLRAGNSRSEVNSFRDISDSLNNLPARMRGHYWSAWNEFMQRRGQAASAAQPGCDPW